MIDLVNNLVIIPLSSPKQNKKGCFVGPSALLEGAKSKAGREPVGCLWSLWHHSGLISFWKVKQADEVKVGEFHQLGRDERRLLKRNCGSEFAVFKCVLARRTSDRLTSPPTDQFRCCMETKRKKIEAECRRDRLLSDWWPAWVASQCSLSLRAAAEMPCWLRDRRWVRHNASPLGLPLTRAVRRLPLVCPWTVTEGNDVFHKAPRRPTSITDHFGFSGLPRLHLSPSWAGLLLLINARTPLLPVTVLEMLSKLVFRHRRGSGLRMRLFHERPHRLII